METTDIAFILLRVETADHYLSEARRLKHHADTLVSTTSHFIIQLLKMKQHGNSYNKPRINPNIKHLSVKYNSR